MKPKLIVFASGTKDGGGSGFENLVNATKTGELDAEIVGVVSNNENGGVRERATRLGVPFIYFPGPYNAEHYQKVVSDAGAEWVALSGWFKLVQGLDPRKTVNIHPMLFSSGDRFRGKGMYGRHIHEAVKAALDAGEITGSGFTMHFVTDEMDGGPVILEHPIPLSKDMSVDEIEDAVKKSEFEWQPKILNKIVHGEISWDGKDPASLKII